MNISGGSGVELRGLRVLDCRVDIGLGRLLWDADIWEQVRRNQGTDGGRERHIFVREEVRLGVVGCRNVFGRGSQFKGTREVGTDAGGLFSGGDHPLIERGADAAPLGLVVDDDKAHKVAAR